jgi:hypothetical protein
MRFSTTPHPFSWGLDLHARRMDVCIVPQDGAILVPRHLHAAPDPCLKAVAPSRAGLVVAVDWLFAWDGLAARCPPEGLPGVRGPALSMHALHGGQATHDTSASPTRAARRRGGLRPQASGSPAARRVSRALLRRRRPRRRPRAALLAPIHHPTRQAPRPAMGPPRASQAHRAGGAERWPAPAVPKSLAVARALRDADAPRRPAVEGARGRLAPPPDPAPCSRWPAVPGRGPRRRRGRLSAIHASRRGPRGHDGLASCRLGTGAPASAGTRSGPAGAPSGQASRPWAGAAAAVRVRRDPPAGHTALTPRQHPHGQGTAVPLLAQQRARAVEAMGPRPTAGARPTGLQAS